MTSERIKQIQETTAYPESLSVSIALKQVWNECAQEAESLRQESEDRIVKIRAEHFKEMVTAQQKISELEKEIDELKFNPETQRLAILCHNRNEQIQSLSARVSDLQNGVTLGLKHLYKYEGFLIAYSKHELLEELELILKEIKSLLTSPQGE